MVAKRCSFFKDYGIGESTILFGSRVDRVVRKKNPPRTVYEVEAVVSMVIHTLEECPPAEVSNLNFEECINPSREQC